MLIDAPKYDTETEDNSGKGSNKNKKIINLTEQTSEDFLKNLF